MNAEFSNRYSSNYSNQSFIDDVKKKDITKGRSKELSRRSLEKTENQNSTLEMAPKKK